MASISKNIKYKSTKEPRLKELPSLGNVHVYQIRGQRGRLCSLWAIARSGPVRIIEYSFLLCYSFHPHLSFLCSGTNIEHDVLTGRSHVVGGTLIPAEVFLRQLNPFLSHLVRVSALSLRGLLTIGPGKP